VLVIAVSQSGGSPDLTGSLQAARECGALTVAVTNNAGSALAEAAEFHVDVLAGHERAVAATKTYTSELLALYLLLEAVAGGDTAAATALPDLTEQLIGQAAEPVAAAAPRYRFAEQMITTARGYAYCTAREAALKLMETCYLSAQAFSGADLLHGPLAMVDREMPVIGVVPRGKAEGATRDVLDRWSPAAATCSWSATRTSFRPPRICRCREWPRNCHRCWKSCRCSCWPATWRWPGAAIPTPPGLTKVTENW